MSNQIEFRHYKYFLALARELHFRKAAESLFISQPGLSRQIKQMEDELGIILFKRHNRKVELTKSGHFLRDELINHFNRLDGIIEHAKLLHKGMDGNLRVAYVGSAMQKLIPSLLLKYKERHSKVVFSLNEMDNNQQITSLLKQEIDIGFVRMNRVPRGISIRSVLEDTFSLVLPQNHPINSDNFKSLLQLKDEPFILFDASYSEFYHENIMQIFDDSGFSPIISHNTVNASSIFRLVENNMGISIVPTGLKEGYNMKVKFVELNNISQTTTLKMVWNSLNSNPLLNGFLEIQKEQNI